MDIIDYVRSFSTGNIWLYKAIFFSNIHLNFLSLKCQGAFMSIIFVSVA